MSEIDWSKAPEWADRVVRSPRQRQLFWADDNSRQYFVIGQRRQDKRHVRNNWEVVERRFLDDPHLLPKTFNCRCVAAPVASTIERRIASLRALEKQVEETRAELTRDLEALGLTWMVQDEPEQPTITDWRDLRVGDVVEAVIPWNNDSVVGEQGVIVEILNDGFFSDFPSQNHYYYFDRHFKEGRVIFIRRP